VFPKCDDCKKEIHTLVPKVYPWRDRLLCFGCWTYRVGIDPITMKRNPLSLIEWEEAVEARRRMGVQLRDVYPEDEARKEKEALESTRKLFERLDGKKTLSTAVETPKPKLVCPKCSTELNDEADSQLHWCERCGHNKPNIVDLSRFIFEQQIWEVKE
jgi:hypothetical protein